MTPAPLDVRVARVIAAPVPFLAYFLIRVPQVTEGGYVPWAEAVPITILTMALFPMWLYWCADLISWRRDRPTLTADEFDATEGTFAGELPDVMQGLPKGADGKFAAVPVHRATNYLAQSQLYAREWAEKQHGKLINAGAVTADGETYLFGTGAHAAVERFGLGEDPVFRVPEVKQEWVMGKVWWANDDRPTEPLLFTHEFTPAAGIRTDSDVIMSWDPAADGQVCIARTENGHVYPVDRVDVVAPAKPETASVERLTGRYRSPFLESPTGRHRKDPPMQPLKSTRTHLPPITEVENVDAYTQLNRTRELPFS